MKGVPLAIVISIAVFWLPIILIVRQLGAFG